MLIILCDCVLNLKIVVKVIMQKSDLLCVEFFYAYTDESNEECKEQSIGDSLS